MYYLSIDATQPMVRVTLSVINTNTYVHIMHCTDCCSSIKVKLNVTAVKAFVGQLLK